ncbi:MAG: hypothetical protein F6K24_30630 [Okeania sp. SIO2D1]|nr:hypothetical protein [Okeania sp. SIO2D1]
MAKIHLWPEVPNIIDDLIHVSTTIETTNQSKFNLWYRFPIKYQDCLTDSCDPFVIATIFLAMSQGCDLIVHGQVSPSLLDNLNEFQLAWSSWKPKIYQKINITADVEKETKKNLEQEVAISAFSGGVDSCFTALCNTKGINLENKKNLQACLMVHGFDIPIKQQEVFARAFLTSQRITASLGLELIPMATNFRQVIKLNWEDVHGVAIASCFYLLTKMYNTGIIASSYSSFDLKGYNINTLPSSYSHKNAHLAWGTNPLTDLFLSSNSLKIVDHGDGYSRLQKIEQMLDWQEFLENLRVCWQGERKDVNCGHCEKCIRTILCFRALGYGLPPCFEEDITDREILNLKLRDYHIS